MNCLFGFIGFDGTVQTDSGLHLTALPGISESLLEGIKDALEADGQTLEHIEKRSILKFRTLFINELNRCWRVSDVNKAECLICANRELLSVSLWYLMGAEMLVETINSERTNRFTTVDLDKTQDLKDEFMDIFTSELHIAVAGIDLSTCVDEPEHSGDIEVIFTLP